jgi:hypothetical protein
VQSVVIRKDRVLEVDVIDCRNLPHHDVGYLAARHEYPTAVVIVRRCDDGVQREECRRVALAAEADGDDRVRSGARTLAAAILGDDGESPYS